MVTNSAKYQINHAIPDLTKRQSAVSLVATLTCFATGRFQQSWLHPADLTCRKGWPD